MDTLVLSPIIVRKIDSNTGGEFTYYQILAGHNRVNAATLAGISDVPAIVKEVSDSEAQLIMVNTNLNQRQELLPSEKAWAYRIQMEASKRKSGERTDLVSIGDKVDTGKTIAQNTTDSKANIFRYIRLTYLISQLLYLVDIGSIPFRAGVELSYITQEEQSILHSYIATHSIKISITQAEELRRYSNEMGSIEDVLIKLFEKPTKAPSVKIDTSAFSRFVPAEYKTKNDIEQYVFRALEYYTSKS